MSEQELILSIFGIASGLGFTTFFFAQIFKLIRMSIEKKHGAQEARDMQLREEFVKFRRQSEQRLATLEAQLSGSPVPAIKESTGPKIALPDLEGEEPEDRLPNMLRQKA